MTGAIYVDLDGTLAHYDKWRGPAHIGEPVLAMAKRVEAWIDKGLQVKIFTARVWSDGSPERDNEAQVAFASIKAWVRKHFGTELYITCIKAPDAIEIWDDRAVSVKRNTGEVIRVAQFL